MVQTMVWTQITAINNKLYNLKNVNLNDYKK